MRPTSKGGGDEGGRALLQVSEYDEVVSYVVPRAVSTEGVSPSPSHERETTYRLWLYSNLRLAAPSGAGGRPPGDAPPPQIGGLPLVGYEDFSVRWPSYADYLSALGAGEEGFRWLDAYFQRAESPWLRSLLGEQPRRRLRIWWMSDSPELDDISWEPIGLGRTPLRPDVSIVRGLPQDSVPPLPLPSGRLTIAVFDPGGLAPDPLRWALADLRGTVDILRIEARDPVEALGQAARAGAEILHIIADASVPFGVEGLLEFSGDAALTANDVNTLLRGSRVVILALQVPAQPGLDRAGLPTVYRGFARFGRAIGDGLTVVAPIGPMAPPDLERFWRAFYQRFAEELDVEDAFIKATPSPKMGPVVLFLRHRFGHQLCREEPGAGAPGADCDPVAARALSVSGRLLGAVTALQERYAAFGEVVPGQELIERERRRQRALAAYLDEALARRRSP